MFFDYELVAQMAKAQATAPKITSYRCDGCDVYGQLPATETPVCWSCGNTVLTTPAYCAISNPSHAPNYARAEA